LLRVFLVFLKKKRLFLEFEIICIICIGFQVFLIMPIGYRHGHDNFVISPNCHILHFNSCECINNIDKTECGLSSGSKSQIFGCFFM
jgi:hypothetical protein